MRFWRKNALLPCTLLALFHNHPLDPSSFVCFINSEIPSWCYPKDTYSEHDMLACSCAMISADPFFSFGVLTLHLWDMNLWKLSIYHKSPSNISRSLDISPSLEFWLVSTFLQVSYEIELQMVILRILLPLCLRANLLGQFCHTLVLLVWELFCLVTISGMA